MNKVRIYKDIVDTRKAYDEALRKEVTTQFEVTYADYYTDGTFVGIGTEDFSPERWSTQVRRGYVYTWNGTRRNRGGNRWFDYQGEITYRRGQRKDLDTFLKTRFPGTEVIDIRTY